MPWFFKKKKRQNKVWLRNGKHLISEKLPHCQKGSKQLLPIYLQILNIPITLLAFAYEKFPRIYNWIDSDTEYVING